MNKELLNTGDILLSDLAKSIADSSNLRVIGIPLFMDYSLPTENLFYSSFFDKLFDSIHYLPVVEEKDAANPEHSSKVKLPPYAISPVKDNYSTIANLSSFEAESDYFKNAHAPLHEVRVPSNIAPPARNKTGKLSIYKSEQSESEATRNIERGASEWFDSTPFDNQATTYSKPDLLSERKAIGNIVSEIQECSNSICFDDQAAASTRADRQLAETSATKNSIKIKGFADFATNFCSPHEDQPSLNHLVNKSITVEKEVLQKSARHASDTTSNKRDEQEETSVTSPPNSMITARSFNGSTSNSEFTRPSPIIERFEDEANAARKSCAPQIEVERLIRLIKEADATQIEGIADALKAALEARSVSDQNYFFKAGTRIPNRPSASSTGVEHFSTSEPSWDLTKHREPEIPKISPAAKSENINEADHLLLKELRTNYQRFYGN